MASRGHGFGAPLTVCLTLVIAMWSVGASPSFAQAGPTFTLLADVDQPYGGLIRGSDGNLYGTSRIGPGASNCGYAYRLEPQLDGTFSRTILHEFAGAPNDGCQPYGELVESPNGVFHGTTYAGGPHIDDGFAPLGTGTIYRMTSNGNITLVLPFAARNDEGVYPEGFAPVAGLTLGSDGHFYGTASSGGSGSNAPAPGTLFRLTSAGDLQVLHNFGVFPATDRSPADALTLGIDGSLYGTFNAGGVSNPAGALFRLTPGDVYSRTFTFPWNECPDPGCYPLGANPWAAATEANGNLYVLGMHYGPSPGGYGTVVRVDSTGVRHLVHAFSGGTDGGYPHRALTLGGDGNLYGLTSGVNQTGPTIFRVAPDGTSFETLHEFVLGGAGPQGRLLEVSPGEFVGTSASSGVGNGFVFRLSLNGLNQAPVASDGSATTFEDTPASGQLSATDPDSDPLSFEIVANGSLGTAAITDTATGAFSYTPNANASGADTFTFKANDGTVDSNIATITVTITPVNDAPVAADGSLSTNQGTTATGTLSATDIDGPALTFTLEQNGTRGTATITNASTGAFTYTPNAGASGADTFTFSVSDGSLSSNIDTIAVNIVPLTVTVISPNGFERVFVSFPTTIRWSATGATSFDVVLSRNGVTGTYVFPISECTGLPGSATSCLWMPQAPGSSSGSIKVIARAGTATAVDTSNATFQLVNATPKITLTTPNTAVTWAETSSRTIQWNHNLGVGSSVRLNLSRNGGATWEVLAASVQNTTASSGKYVWLVSGPATTAALVHVVWLDGPVSDVSNTTFAIVAPSLTVTSPNTAVTWAAGTNHTLVASHNLGAGPSIAFDVSRDGGSTWTAIGAATSTTAGANLSWTVTGPPTTQARIRATWTANPVVSDMSNVNFTISPRVTVTAPNSPVAWGAGTLRTVTWTHTLGVGQLVNIDVSTNNGATWSSVATNVPNTTSTTGSATVRMPETVTTQALVRVSPVSFPLVDGDVSNVPFTLSVPGVTVTMPNSNVLWTIGSNRTITWAHNLGTAESVNLEISRDGGTTWTAIATNALNSTNTAGSFIWTVTGPATLEARLRVTWIANASVQDISNANFRIQ